MTEDNSVSWEISLLYFRDHSYICVAYLQPPSVLAPVHAIDPICPKKLKSNDCQYDSIVFILVAASSLTKQLYNGLNTGNKVLKCVKREK